VLLGLFCAFLTVYTWFWMHSRRVLLLHALEIVVVAGFAGVILALARLPWLATPAWRRFCTWMGWLSYPLYLFHQPLLGLVDLLFLPGATFAGSPVWQAGSLFFIAPLAVTALLGIPLEKRLLRWRREALGTAPRKLRP
jgi:peptidoglycan/LPS O-acetylase OafA/YrhL